MFVIDRIVEINAPAATVWQVITDLPRYGEWNPFCLAARSTLKPGDSMEMTVKLGAKSQQVIEVMQELVPGQRFAYHMKPAPLGALSSLRSHDITPLGPNRARYRSYFELKGWLMPLVRALLGSKLEQGFGGMTEAVARRCEQLRKG